MSCNQKPKLTPTGNHLSGKLTMIMVAVISLQMTTTSVLHVNGL